MSQLAEERERETKYACHRLATMRNRNWTVECRADGRIPNSALLRPPAPQYQDGTERQNQTRHKYVDDNTGQGGALVVQHHQFAVWRYQLRATWRKVLTIGSTGVEVMDFRPNVTIADMTAGPANSLLMSWIEHESPGSTSWTSHLADLF